jgi:FkbM family methyltransferase
MKAFFKIRLYHFKKHLYANCSWLIAIYFSHFHTPKKRTITSIFDQYSKQAKQRINIIQIGGNDGFHNDPVCRFVKRDHWKGVILEPQKNVFPTLAYVYKQNDITPLNKAIAKESGSIILYKIAFSQARWATGLASFNKAAILSAIESGYVRKRALKDGTELPNNMEDYISEEIVETTSFEDLIINHQLGPINILQIDVEGFDFEVIKMINLNSIAPDLVSYEHEKLSNEDQKQAKYLLKSKGYKIIAMNRDTVAHKAELQFEV